MNLKFNYQNNASYKRTYRTSLEKYC